MIYLDVYEEKRHKETRKLSVEDLTAELLKKYGSEAELLKVLESAVEFDFSPVIFDVTSDPDKERYVTADLDSVRKAAEKIRERGVKNGKAE